MNTKEFRLLVTRFSICAIVFCLCLAPAMSMAQNHVAGGDYSAVAYSTHSGSGPKPKVLLVGTYQGKKGKYDTTREAVNAASPGDWILIGPGVYHEQGAANAGVLITTPNLDLRGMDRNQVVVDGTYPGYGTCSSNSAA